MSDAAGFGVPVSAPAAFDAIAAEYDARFTDQPIARRLRARVWRTAEAAFAPGGRILDIGCGTGVDAWHLAACGFDVVGIDPSAAMVAIARDRGQSAGAGVGDGDDATLAHAFNAPRFVVGTVPALLAGRALSDGGSPFDGALANFGALNAVPDLPLLGRALADLLRPGAMVVAVVMGPFCAWETAVHLARGDMARAARRWRRRGVRADVGGGGFVVRYPSPAALARELGSMFRLVSGSGLGSVLPPTWATRAAGWLNARPPWLARLDRADVAVGGLWIAAHTADHYVAVLERR